MILGRKQENERSITSEDLFFFREHYDFGAKNERSTTSEDLFFREYANLIATWLLKSTFVGVPF